MKQQSTLTITAWILAGVLVFSGTAEMRAAVLCVGDDGHTDVEILASFCCAEGELPLTRELASNVIAANDHCGDCVDLSLEAHFVKASKSGLLFEGVSCLRSSRNGAGSENRTRFARADDPSLDHLQAAHSSVVLLI